MSWRGIEPRPPRWKASTLVKSYSKSILIAIRNIYIWARDMAPQVHEHEQWTHMTALGCGPNSTRKSFNPEYWRQTLASSCIHCQARRITLGSPLWRDLTKGLRSVGGERSSKDLFKQPVNKYSEFLHMSPRQFYCLWIFLPLFVYSWIWDMGEWWWKWLPY